MRKFQFPVILGLMILLASSCAKKSEANMSSMVAADSVAVIDDNGYVGSSAAVENKKDSTHKFVRTANLKFKVKNVIKSTYKIEDVTAQQGGFVTYTNLTSFVNNKETIKISADSSVVTTYFTVTNTITLRVPNTKLDTTLKDIAKLIDFLDFRTIKADDVAMQLLSNSLAMKRSARNEARLTRAIDNRGKKLYETTDAEETLLNKQEQADNARVSNLTLRDQINFSTINIEIYQQESVKTEMIPNNDNLDKYQPGLGSKLVEALKSGWEMLEACLIFVINLWGLILLAVASYFIYKILKTKFKK